MIHLPPDHHRTSEKNCSNNPRSSSGGPSLPSDITGVATCAHHPLANSALLPLRDGGDDGARYVRFSNRPFRVKRFQTIHDSGVNVAHGLALLFGLGTKALPSWDSKTRWNNLYRGLTVG